MNDKIKQAIAEAKAAMNKLFVMRDRIEDRICKIDCLVENQEMWIESLLHEMESNDRLEDGQTPETPNLQLEMEIRHRRQRIELAGKVKRARIRQISQMDRMIDDIS